MSHIQMPIFDFGWSFTGDKLAVVGNAAALDNKVRVYNKNLQLDGHLNGDYYDLKNLSWISDGDSIAAIITHIYDEFTGHETYNSMIRIWNAQSREIINELSTDPQHNPILFSASPNSGFLASFIGNRQLPHIKIWNVRSLKEIVTIQVEDAIRNIDWDSTASSILMSNYKDEYSLFDIKRGTLLWKRQIACLCQRKDQSLLGIDTQGRIQLWNMRNDTDGTLFTELSDAPMRFAKWNSNGRYVLSIDHDGLLYLWSTAEGFIDKPCGDDAVDKFIWSPEGTRFATIVKNTVRIQDIHQKKPYRTYQDDDHHILDVKWNPVGDRIALETKNGISLWIFDD